MTQAEQQRAAKEFAAFWKDKGDEKQETQRYWIGLLTELFSLHFSRQSGMLTSCPTMCVLAGLW